MNKIFTSDEKKIVLFLAIFLFLGILILNSGKIISNQKEQDISSINDTMQKIIEKSNTPPKININEADIETLKELKGVGPKTALKIFNYREKHGKFKSLTDLTKVKGIGKKTLAKLLPNLKLVGDSASIYTFINTEEQAEEVNKDTHVNINKANIAKLMSLYRIGEVTAQKIIDYREKNGFFKKKEDIMNIKGIGSGTFEKIKHRIIISDE